MIGLEIDLTDEVTTSGPGMSEVISFTIPYDRIFVNNEYFKTKTKQLGQFIIVDCGCPRSLMGIKELERLKRIVHIETKNVEEERFRFGPSKIYCSKLKVVFPMKLGDTTVTTEFFVVNGDVPILLGNDTSGSQIRHGK